MSYRCPVCGYDDMPHEPKDYNICPCCGVEFGLDDAFDTHEELRNLWLAKGAPWFSLHKPYTPPLNWSAWDQLDRAGLRYSVPRPEPAVKVEYHRVSQSRPVAGKLMMVA